MSRWRSFVRRASSITANVATESPSASCIVACSQRAASVDGTNVFSGPYSGTLCPRRPNVQNIVERHFDYRHFLLLYGQGEPLLCRDLFEMIRYERARGRYVVFASQASDLVPNDTNNAGDIFVRDRVDGHGIGRGGFRGFDRPQDFPGLGIASDELAGSMACIDHPVSNNGR